MSRYESKEAYNEYYREYRRTHKERIREIGREHMRKVRAEERLLQHRLLKGKKTV